VKGHPALNDKENTPTVATGESKSDANPANSPKPAASSDR
jgi:hypothetical protein